MRMGERGGALREGAGMTSVVTRCVACLCALQDEEGKYAKVVKIGNKIYAIPQVSYLKTRLPTASRSIKP
jgi:hypothetical protein